MPGLIRVSGHAERLAALDVVRHFTDRLVAITVGANKSDDAAAFAAELRMMNVRPHMAQNTNRRRSAIDSGTPAYL